MVDLGLVLGTLTDFLSLVPATLFDDVDRALVDVLLLEQLIRIQQRSILEGLQPAALEGRQFSTSGRSLSQKILSEMGEKSGAERSTRRGFCKLISTNWRL